MSGATKGDDCKSAASWLRRFESCLPHQPSLASRATAGQARPTLSKTKRGEGVSPKPARAKADLDQPDCEPPLGRPGKLSPKRRGRRRTSASPIASYGSAGL